MKNAAIFLFLSLVHAIAAAPALDGSYNQWKEALRAAVTPQTNIIAPPGFVVELVRAARPEEGSWVSLAFDPSGRPMIAREDRGLLRLTFPTNANAAVRAETFATNLLECRGLLFAHGALYANANNSKGLYRLRDAGGDGQFEEIRLLKATAGGVGHGRNDLALGPDGFIYSIHGDDVRVPDEAAAISPFRGLAPSGLLPCAWGNNLYGSGVTPPGGHLVRTDSDGQRWEIVAAGLRNPYGIDFNAAGEPFTYDADLEWDIGLPWYQPTRVLHLVPGADYGWRRGASNLPTWAPDSRPSAADIGKGSPTAIRFGTRSSFPGAWRRALFALDWTYGRIWAVHLTPRGASYAGLSEIFLQGRPLNVTDLDFGPDGSLWFITGGRQTQSGLYRVRYTGEAGIEAPPSAKTLEHERACAELRALRRQLESLARTEQTNALALAWPQLGHEDEWIRHAARAALERQPVAAWQERALAENRSAAAPAALLALARNGSKELKPRLLERLSALPLAELATEQKLAVLRAFEIAFIRWGKPGPETASALEAQFDAAFPDRDRRVNQQLCELLVYLGSTNVVSKTLPLLVGAATQEEKLRYLHLLRLAENGWTLAQRRAYFEALRGARNFTGAHYLPLVLKYIHAEAEAALTPADRAALADALAPPETPPIAGSPSNPHRRFVKNWELADFFPKPGEETPPRDLRQGRALFAEAGCRQCHQFGGEGGLNGPDLTGVAGRFGRRDLLEHTLYPSKVIAENYRNISITTKAGLILEGRLIAEDAQSLTLATNPIDPDHRSSVRKREIASQRVSELSPMPAGLLDSLTREEILDLLAFLESSPGDAPRKLD